MSFKLTDFITVSNTGITTFGSDGILINRTSADAYLFFQKSGTNRGAIYGGDASDGNGLRFFIGNNSDPSLSIVSNGQVGIGGTPSYTLHVSGNIIAVEDSTPALRLIGGTTSFDLKSDGGVFKVRDVSGGNELYHIAAGGSGYHKWYINDSLKMTLDSSGNVGIGATPSSKLHIRTSTNFNYEFEEVSSKLRLSALNDARSANVPLQFAASEFSFITGNVGIGTTTPEELLDIKATSSPAIQLNQADTYKALLKLGGNDLEIRGSSGAMEFYNGTADGDSSALRMQITAAGLVGIGITPTETLTLGGVANVQLTLKSNDTSNGYSEIYFGDTDATNRGFISYSHSSDAMDIGTAASTRLRITSGGDVGIGTTSPVKTLDVQGQLAISNSNTSYYYMDRNDTNGNFEIKNDSDSNLLTLTSGGDAFLGAYNGTPASTYNKFYYMKSAPYNWDCGNTYNPNYEIAAIGIGSTGAGQDDGTILFQTAINVCSNSAASVLTTKMEITPEGDVLAANASTGGNLYVGRSGGNGTSAAQQQELFLRGYSLYQTSDANYYGQYGFIQFNADNGWTGGARKFAITNGYLGTNFAVLRSTSAREDIVLDGNGGATNTSIVDFTIANTGYATFYNGFTYNENANQAGFVCKYTGATPLNVSVSTYNNLFNIYNETNNVSILNYNQTSNVITAPNKINAGSLQGQNLNSGNIYADGSGLISNTNPSDSRLKRNIENIDFGLAEILKLRSVKFNWLEDDESAKKQFGFIAQEVKEVIPQSVGKFDNNGKTRFSLEKDAIYVGLVKAIQEQQTQIEELKSEIQLLKNN